LYPDPWLLLLLLYPGVQMGELAPYLATQLLLPLLPLLP
jgi:hypothetical protein